MQHHVHDGRDAGDSVLVRGHDRCHDDDVGDLADFSRLNVDDGGLDPASVTGVVICAEGDQQQQQEGVEYHQQISVLRHDFHVDGGNDGESHHTNDRCADLNGDIAEVTAEFVRGSGACDNNTAKSGRNKAQKKQNPVALLGKVLQFGEKLIQGPASFLSAHYSIK